MKKRLFYVAFLLFCFGFRLADQYQYIHQHGKFLILYNTSGEHALPSSKQKDLNKNGVPDFIENIAIQLITADQLYQDVFSLRSPLNSPRYLKEEVAFIKVNMKNGMDFDGIAYDHVSRIQYQEQQKAWDAKTLVIDISNSIKHTNHTPAHELMHLYQNGYTLFKTRWYTEGMARWVEAALAKGTGKIGELPRTVEERQKQVFDQTYGAAKFWTALAKATDQQEGKLDLEEKLLACVYTNGEPVIEDAYFYGAVLLKEVLEALDEEDNVVSRREGLKPYFWEEKRQKSADNNENIWKAIERTAKKLGLPYSVE